MQKYVWNNASLLIGSLCNSDYERDIKLEVFKHSDDRKHTLEGIKLFTLDDIKDDSTFETQLEDCKGIKSITLTDIEFRK